MGSIRRTEIPGFEDIQQLPTVEVTVESLLNSDSPRVTGEDSEHVKTLAELSDQLPPLIVHRSTMRVIDGMHRLLAARLNGQKMIAVRFYDGDGASAFVLAVKANITHGLPLSLADRKGAAARIIAYYPQWSDRSIALASGLSPRTVAGIRKRPSEQSRQMDVRIGRDGRARPMDISEKRKQAVLLVANQPGASLREIARQVGISPETVRRIRDSLSGPQKSPETGNNKPESRIYPGAVRPQLTAKAEKSDDKSALRLLGTDPALRSTERGRLLLRMLSVSSIISQQGKDILETVPVHCTPRIAEASRACAQAWMKFAELSEQRSGDLASLSISMEGSCPVGVLM